MAMYFQCELSRGQRRTIGWIEERAAKRGASVELVSADGEFWKVETVFKPGLEEKALRAKQANDRNSLASIKAG